MPSSLIYLAFPVLFLLSSQHVDATLWERTYGSRADMAFSGITTFAHLPSLTCLTSRTPFDIAVVGYPFDTAVSYRPGTRFGPHGIRDGSRRLRAISGWSMYWKFNPYDGDVAVVDCGDVPLIGIL
jgi:agmatinase